MTEWTRDMVEERVDEAADVLRQLPPVRVSGYSAPGRNPAQLRRHGGREAGADAETAAEPRRDQPDGGGDHLEPLPRARRRPPDVGAGRRHAVEAPLLPLRHQSADGAPAIRLRAQRHRLAAERPAGAPSARAAVRRSAGGIRTRTRATRQSSRSIVMSTSDISPMACRVCWG